MDTTDAPPKIVVTYSEATALFKSGKDLTYDELADKVLLQTNLPIIKCPPSDPEKRDEYLRAKRILVQRLKDLKKKWKKQCRKLKDSEANDVLFDIVCNKLHLI